MIVEWGISSNSWWSLNMGCIPMPLFYEVGVSMHTRELCHFLNHVKCGYKVIIINTINIPSSYWHHYVRKTCNRLLPTAWPIWHIMWMKSEYCLFMHQIQYWSICNLPYIEFQQINIDEKKNQQKCIPQNSDQSFVQYQVI